MNNPFHGLIFKKLSKTHQKELNDALESVRGPFLFDPVKPFTFDSIWVEDDTPLDSFNSTVTMVIAVIER